MQVCARKKEPRCLEVMAAVRGTASSRTSCSTCACQPSSGLQHAREHARTSRYHMQKATRPILPYKAKPMSRISATPASTHFGAGCFVRNCAAKTKFGRRCGVQYVGQM